MSRFTLTALPLAGLTLVQRHPLGDARGYLERLYCRDDLALVLQGRAIAQINHTLTAKAGTVRGMHFQHLPYPVMKFVTCLRGEAFDVAVDLRQGSPTFLRWHAELLTADNYRTLVIPEGFAHGFQSLSDDCELLYLHTAAFHPETEGAVNATDPRLGITWPLPITDRSARDQAHPLLDVDYPGIALP
mgnify:CR=1 FL=1